MSLVSRLVGFVQEAIGPPIDAAQAFDVSDERLAAAALLVHVARVDGVFDRAERAALLDLLGSGYGLAPQAAEALLARADRFDHEVDDVATLVEMVGHDAGDRTRLLAMAYRVASTDGVVGEFESDLVWRMGRLLGLTDEAVERIRTDALGAAAQG